MTTLSSRVKLPGREADQSPPTSAEVKKMWLYTSTSSCVFMAQCLISSAQGHLYLLLKQKRLNRPHWTLTIEVKDLGWLGSPANDSAAARPLPHYSAEGTSLCTPETREEIAMFNQKTSY
jgi:hypothetical protein